MMADAGEDELGRFTGKISVCYIDTLLDVPESALAPMIDDACTTLRQALVSYAQTVRSSK